MNGSFFNVGNGNPTFKIFYVLALPDWEPNEVTPFQGFAPGLINFIPLMQIIPTLPADILEPLLDSDARLARRRCGEGSWIWTPVNLSTLLSKRKPTIQYPFIVIFSADRKTAKAISTWRSSLRIRPIHVSFFKGVGAIHPSQLTQEILRQHLLTLTRKISEIDKTIDVTEHLGALKSWKSYRKIPLALSYHSHNVTRPNEMVLLGANKELCLQDEGCLNNSPVENYVRGITESAENVMSLWEGNNWPPAYLMHPPFPDVFLIAPSVYAGSLKRIEGLAPLSSQKKALQTLERQNDYTLSIRFDDKTGQNIDSYLNEIGPILSLRGAEMKLTTTAVGLRTAGTVAATIRLPPSVNRTGGVVGQLSRFLRTHENPPAIKAARVFRTVQDALHRIIPEEHLKLISRSKTGIKIIADAPIEWLPINGIPLGIRFDVSRINSTPGNLFLEQIRSFVPVSIPPDAFRNYLMVSMFEDEDQIAPYLRAATLSTRDGNNKNIIGRFVSPKTAGEFAEAIQSFNGPMLIIDSHGEHQVGDVPGGLIINGKSFDVWSLAGKVQMPPIVVLSACDTHPFDRSHATVANGFLACGALAVVATALPVRALSASRFIVRLINRAVHFAEIVNNAGQAVPWTHIVGGVIRMELATDIIRCFEEKEFYNDEQASELLLKTNMDLNPLNPDWYEHLLERVSTLCGLDSHVFNQMLDDVIASSDAIRYLHLGNPEAIILANEKVKMKAFDTAGLLEGNPT